MCSLIVTEASEVVSLYPGEQVLSKHAWAGLFEVADQTVGAAFVRGERQILAPDQVQPFPLGGVDVGQFPVFIAGFQATGQRPDGYIYHAWSQELDIHASTMAAHLPSGRILEWQVTQLDAL
jgi:hypothetical protein